MARCLFCITQLNRYVIINVPLLLTNPFVFQPQDVQMYRRQVRWKGDERLLLVPVQKDQQLNRQYQRETNRLKFPLEC